MPKLRVCLLAGNEEAIYRAEENLAGLEQHLESAHPFTCERVSVTRDGDRFDNLAAFQHADVAVIFVRRKRPDPETLAAIRRFLAAGKGVVALRTTSHAWETWPEFDIEVLGAKYGRHAGNADALEFLDPAHPILTGAHEFRTNHDIYHYELRRKPPELQVLIEGSNAKGKNPVAWTTVYQGARIFYLGLGHNDEFAKPAFQRLVANGIYWAGRRAVPGAELRIERTYLPDAKPSAFAVGLPNGVSFSYDVVRGGVNAIWDGGFIDVASVRPGRGKNYKPVTLLGPVMYRETGDAPLRCGDPQRVPVVKLTAYRLNGADVEFHYQLDDVPVRESVSASGDGRSLIRRFRVNRSAGPIWYVPASQEGGKSVISGAQKESAGWRITPDASGEFTIEIDWRRAES